MAEGNNGAHLTPNGGWFGYLPFITTSTALNQSEQGFTVTPFGASLGLTNNDINGNASHNIFNGTFGLNIVDVDANGNIMSLAGRNLPTPNSVPEPTSALALLAFGATGGVLLKRKQQHKA
ncbi:PEP-CTERM sorting domain-containing protein [Planktothrix sp. FACHB-1355]|uniref:PEP-CTERM sorting domain-containing protein n=3 Tax=Oscillatoriophycideae TaxID=1301283 RepID=A0A926VBG5_9CYAN|nr:PEP-CTERM sorting domain-containing protein [Aerosakkonema funiforme FACHB-1375]MBD3558417.1 PEP-CTERM sorting domain-containing protein [Planktothrix sp. FACHB-1355]